MKTRDLSGPIVIAGIALVTGAGAAMRNAHNAAAANETGPRLPAVADARHSLSTTPRHIEWIAAPLGVKRILAFVVSPERSDRAPVVIVTADDQGASDWARAVADRVAELGSLQ
jgi:carboxymethylenebutenolidase